MSRVSIITFRDATSPIDVEEPVSCTPFLNESGKLLDCSTRNFSRIPRSSSFCLRHSITCRIASQHSNRNKILQSRTITFVIMYTPRRKSSTQHKQITTIGTKIYLTVMPILAKTECKKKYTFKRKRPLRISLHIKSLHSKP